MWWKSPWLNVKEGCTLRQLSFWWPFDRNTSGMGNLESNVLPQSKQNFGKMMWKMCIPLRGIVFWRCSKSKKVSGQVICSKKSFYKRFYINHNITWVISSHVCKNSTFFCRRCKKLTLKPFVTFCFICLYLDSFIGFYLFYFRFCNVKQLFNLFDPFDGYFTSTTLRNTLIHSVRIIAIY